MAKQSKTSLAGILAWITGVLVSLSVGSGMISQVLTIPYIPAVVTVVAGWVVVVGIILSVIVSIFER